MQMQFLSRKPFTARRLVFLGLLVSQSLVLYLVESLIPLSFAVPGAKLGLSNIIGLSTLLLFGIGDAVLVTLMRITISSLFWGGMSVFLFSLCGGMLSLLAMHALRSAFKEKIGIPGLSVAGAVFHNIGQLLAAAIVIENIRIIYYLPMLLLAAVPTGMLVGICTHFMTMHIRKIYGRRILEK